MQAGIYKSYLPRQYGRKSVWYIHSPNKGLSLGK